MKKTNEVKVIKPTKIERSLSATTETLRVAAYVRVSTDHKEQIESYNSQIAYYTDLIANNPAWVNIGIYADEGISGTRTEKRDDFNRLITDCTSGKIDMVLTKSLSRFSRNTVDTLNYIRLLKEHNVAIVFEQENINTLTLNGELLLTVLSAVNQQYVENLSESVKHGLHAKMTRGEHVGDPAALGYDSIPDDNTTLLINEDEAEIVRYIFKRYLEGAGGRMIGGELETLGYKTKRGRSTWGESTVLSILKNEKYTGELLQGKSITTDPISQRRLSNRGESAMYSKPDAHPAIISREDFDKAQAIRSKRNEGRTTPTDKNRNRFSRKYAFSSMLRCGYCGNSLSRRRTNSGTSSQSWVWHCVTYIKKGKENCPECKALHETIIEGAFVQSYNLLAGDNSEVLCEFLDRLDNTLLATGTDKQLTKINKRIKNLELKLRKLLDYLLDGIITQTVYADKKASIDEELLPLYEEQEVLQGATTDEDDLQEQLGRYKSALESQETLQGFDRSTFETIIDHAVIGERLEDGTLDPNKITFVYRAGIDAPDIEDNLCSFTQNKACGMLCIDVKGKERKT